MRSMSFGLPAIFGPELMWKMPHRIVPVGLRRLARPVSKIGQTGFKKMLWLHLLNMAVSLNWVSFLGVFVIRALVFEVYTRAPDFWKLPHTSNKPQKNIGNYVGSYGWWSKLWSPFGSLV